MGYVGVRRVYHAVICRLSAARISRPFEAGAAAAERSGEGRMRAALALMVAFDMSTNAASHRILLAGKRPV